MIFYAEYYQINKILYFLFKLYRCLQLSYETYTTYLGKLKTAADSDREIYYYIHSLLVDLPCITFSSYLLTNKHFPHTLIDKKHIINSTKGIDYLH